MRTLIFFVGIFISTSASFADPKDALEATEVKAHVKTVDPQIGQCYLGAVGERIGAGRLDVELTIHRKGIVDHVDVIAPGVDAKTAKKIGACVRKTLADVSFPARRVGTTAVVPYFWQKTTARGDGPQYSCWNAKGCKTGSASHAASQPAPATKKAVSGRQARRAKPST